MQLKLKRSQRKTLTGKIVYQLEVRADIPQEELDLIKKYKLGNEIVYSSQTHQALTGGAQAAAALSKQLGALSGESWGMLGKGMGLSLMSRFAEKITVNDLLKGRTIECKDLNEMLDTEQAVVTACQNLKAYIEAAESFDGRELVIDI